MNRKVVELGKNCLVVSLPIKWARGNDVSKGDELEIDEIEGRLLIEPVQKKTREAKEAELDLTETPDELIRTEIGFAYAHGYDRINVKYNKDQYGKIKDAVQNVILGFDISNKKDTTLVIDEVTAPEDDKKEQIFRRALITTSESLQMLHDDLKNNSFGNMSSSLEQAQRVTVFTNFCQRSVSRNRFAAEKIKRHNTLYEMIRLIENNIFHLYSAITRHNLKKVTPAAAEAAKKMLQFYNNLRDAYIKKDVRALEQNSENLRRYRYDVMDINIINSKGTESLILHYLAEICWLIDIANKITISLFLF